MLKKVFILLGIALILTGCTNEIPQVGTSSSYDSPLYAGEPNINLKIDYADRWCFGNFRYRK